MTPYTENSSQRTVTAGQVPMTPTVIEWLAIKSALAVNIWVEPGYWVIRYDDNGEFTSVEAGTFASLYTAAP